MGGSVPGSMASAGGGIGAALTNRIGQSPLVAALQTLNGSTPQGAAAATQPQIASTSPAGNPAGVTTQPSAGGDDLEAFTREVAAKYGVDPDVAVRVGNSEGGFKDPTRRSLYKKNGKQEPSYGPFQLLVGGGDTGFPEGMGNQMIRETGLDPRDPKNAKAGIEFAMKQASQKGWGQWYGAAKAGVGNFDGIKGRSTGSADTSVAQAGGTIPRVLAAAQGQPFDFAPAAGASAPSGETAQPKKTTLDRVIELASKSQPQMAPGGGGAGAQAGQGQQAQPSETVDLAEQDVAQLQQEQAQKRATPNQRSAARKQALTNRTRYTG